jgi:hypothetical protein
MSAAHFRAMMADLYERSALLCRQGNGEAAYLVAAWAKDVARNSRDTERFYRCGLRLCGLSILEEDAAVAAILDGKHPPDSLAGRLAAYKGKVEREIQWGPGVYREHRCEGEVHALGAALEWIGVKSLQVLKETKE